MSRALALDAAWIFAAFLVVVVLAAVGIAGRRILLDRGGGTVECGLRRPGGTWRLGVAAYGAGELRWYDGFGVLLTPEEVLSRGSLSVTSRRDADAAEAGSPRPGMGLVPCPRGGKPGTVRAALGRTPATRLLASPGDRPTRPH